MFELSTESYPSFLRSSHLYSYLPAAVLRASPKLEYCLCNCLIPGAADSEKVWNIYANFFFFKNCSHRFCQFPLFKRYILGNKLTNDFLDGYLDLVFGYVFKKFCGILEKFCFWGDITALLHLLLDFMVGFWSWNLSFVGVACVWLSTMLISVFPSILSVLSTVHQHFASFCWNVPLSLTFFTKLIKAIRQLFYQISLVLQLTKSVFQFLFYQRLSVAPESFFCTFSIFERNNIHSTFRFFQHKIGRLDDGQVYVQFDAPWRLVGKGVNAMCVYVFFYHKFCMLESQKVLIFSKISTTKKSPLLQKAKSLVFCQKIQVHSVLHPGIFWAIIFLLAPNGMAC